jgi:protein involved in polysaccharide export with SLBB domain
MKNLKFSIIAFIGFIFISSQAFTQQINIDQLSNEQLIQYLGIANASGLTEKELETKARQKGLSEEQIQKLKLRVSALNSGSKSLENKDISETRVLSIPKKQVKDSSIINTAEVKVFGSDLFSSENLTFEPNLQIPTPRNYTIGVGDQLNIDLFGYSDINYKLKVSPEGVIRIPNAGPVRVVGLNFEDAQLKIKSELTNIYPQIATGKTAVQVSVGQMRSIKVTLIGEITKPGSYTLPSLASIANALYVSGGPNNIGSYRDIELVRNGKTISHFDLYDFLLRGDLTNNKRLEDDDIIKVNTYKAHVTMVGSVKRKAIYEINASENIADLLKLAGGFKDDAFRDFIRVVRFGKNDKEMLTVKSTDFTNFKLQTGDSCFVDEVANKFSNRVTIAGAIFHPGNYALKDFSNLKSLLTIANLKQEAYLKRGIITRRGENYILKQLDFNIADILASKNNIELKNEDSVKIYSVFDIRQEYTVSINGEVIKPGVYPFTDSVQLQNLILLAGGFTEAASKKRIEIARRIRDSATNESDTNRYAIVTTIELNKRLEEKKDMAQIVLQPFDIVSVRRDPSYKEQMIVKIEGEVLYPGDYSIEKTKERLSDLVQKSGGLKADAYPKGAVLIRSDNSINHKAQDIERLNLLGSSDSTKYLNSDSLINKINTFTSSVGIDLKEALDHPGGKADIYVESGDILTIPRQTQTVKTWGAVYLPKQIVYEGTRFKTYINQSGGFAGNAFRSKSFVVYANGSVARTRHFLFFKNYPRVETGAEVFVPLKQAKRTSTIADIGSIASILVGISTALISLIYISKL